MQAQLTLSAEQKPTIQTKVITMNSELQSFIQNAQRTTGVAGGAGAARGGRGAAPVAPWRRRWRAPGTLGTTLTTQQLKLRDDFLTLANGHQVKINAELTDDQKLQWETYKINYWLAPHLSGISLSEDQKDKIKTLVEDTAKATGKAADAAEIETQLGRLYRKIMGNVLTEPQAMLAMILQTGGRGATTGAGAGGRWQHRGRGRTRRSRRGRNGRDGWWEAWEAWVAAVPVEVAEEDGAVVEAWVEAEAWVAAGWAVVAWVVVAEGDGVAGVWVEAEWVVAWVAAGGRERFAVIAPETLKNARPGDGRPALFHFDMKLAPNKWRRGRCPSCVRLRRASMMHACLTPLRLPTSIRAIVKGSARWWRCAALI